MPPRATMAASTLCRSVVHGPRTVLSTVAATSVSRLLTGPGAAFGVSLQTPAAVRLPQAVVVPGLPVGEPTISVGQGALWYDDERVAVTRWLTPSRVQRASVPPERAAGRAIARLLDEWPGLLGWGDGLTPFGDDVLCGALLGLRALGHPGEVRLARALDGPDLDRATTPVSAALLRAAIDGWCIPQVAGFVSALTGGSPTPHATREAMLAVGHSSGRGLMAGISRVMTDVDLAEAA